MQWSSANKSYVIGAILLVAIAVGGFVVIKKHTPPVASSIELSSVSQVSEHELEPAVKKIFETRCTVCHSCYNAPCQLNLTSYEGFRRGASNELLYNSKRMKAIPPTRLYTDAHTTDEWRNKGFHAITRFGLSGDPRNVTDSILHKLITHRKQHSPSTYVPAEQSVTCPSNMEETKQFLVDRPDAGMPYGLPALEEKEIAVITDWLLRGAPGPADETNVKDHVTQSQLETLRGWENFFNAGDNKTRLVSRYLYEHLFLAHIAFNDIPNQFFRLVRSQTECTAGVQEIATVRPYDDPKSENFKYCFRRLPGTPVEKSHIVYRLSPQKMARFKELFYKSDWQATRVPTYDPATRSNPFITFQEIPGKARYQFLLDDAQYHIMTFIKGPVCRGNTAVNSIQEQFLVIFLDPDSDPYSGSKEFAQKAAEFHKLPADWGSNIVPSVSKISEMINYGIIAGRNQYRDYRNQHYTKTHPKGYGLNDIWDGDGHNSNALLTVFRHNDSAAVVRGAVGDVSKTTFMLDYVIFERLSYDLVSGFDVFGDLGHQLTTRIYMALIRMEAEELFLNFLPSPTRKALHDYWYRGTLTGVKMKYLYPLVGLDRPTQMTFTSPQNAKNEFWEQVLTKRMTPQVRGKLDSINWSLSSPAAERDSRLEPIESEFRKVVSRPSKSAKYVLQMPDLAFIRVKMGGNGSNDLVYSLVRNKEHSNIAWINFENIRRDDKQSDSISITRGFTGSFPNRFYVVDQERVPQFVADLEKVDSPARAIEFNAKYAIGRSYQTFWQHSDWFNWKARQLNGLDAGIYDLNRYELPRSEQD